MRCSNCRNEITDNLLGILYHTEGQWSGYFRGDNNGTEYFITLCTNCRTYKFEKDIGAFQSKTHKVFKLKQ